MKKLGLKPKFHWLNRYKKITIIFQQLPSVGFLKSNLRRLKLHRYLHWLMLGLTILVLGLGVSLDFQQKTKVSQAATFTKNWTSYNDFQYVNGVSGTTSTQSGVTINGSGTPTDGGAGTVTLTSTSSSTTQTTDTDFDAGTFSQTAMVGTGSDANVVAKVDAWWDVNYSYQKQLTVTNSTAAATLSSGTTVSLNVNTKSLYDSSKLQADCDDLRVVRYSDSIFTELTRSLTYASGSTGCSDSNSTTVSFTTQADIAANSSDSTYYLYYGYSTASTPTNTLAAYNVGTASATFVSPFNGDLAAMASGSGTPTASSGAIRYSGGRSAIRLNGVGGGTTSLSSWLVGTPSALTMEAWIYFDSANSVYSGNGFMVMEDGCCTNYNIYYGGGTSVQGYIGGKQVSGTSGSLIGSWHHAAVVYDSSSIKLFLDGNLIGTNNSPGTLAAPHSTLVVGGRGTSTMNWPGKVDEVRVSTAARYSTNFTPSTAPFVRDADTRILYHYDENGLDPRNSGKAIDDSGNGLHGTLTSPIAYSTGLTGVDISSSESGTVSAQPYASHNGVFIEEATTNKITNPSFEHATFSQNWTASNSATLSANTTAPYYKFGSTSLKLNNSSPSTNYSEANGDTTQGLYNTTASKRLAQGFQVSENSTISAASLHMYGSNPLSTRYMRVEIQTDDGGAPSGTPVTDGTSDCLAMSPYAPLSNNYADFLFSSPPSLTATTQYHLVLRAFTNSECSTEQSAASGNYAAWRYDNSSSTYANGERAMMNESGTWTTGTNTDYIFALYTQKSTLTTTVNVGNTNTHTLSAYVHNGAVNSPRTGAIDATLAKLIFNGTAQTTTYTSIGGGWWRLSYTAAGINGDADYGIEVQGGRPIYIDGFQLEEKSYATTYADGSLETGYSWSGTANNSTSSRTTEKLEYSATSNISNSSGTVSLWAKPNWSSGDLFSGAYYVRRYFSTCQYVDGFYIGTGSNASGVSNSSVEVSPCSNGSGSITKSTTVTRGNWYHFVLTWDGTNGTLYVNNSSASSALTWVSPAGIYLSHTDGTLNPNSVISDLRLFDKPLTSTEVADLYRSGLTSHSEASESNAKYSSSGDFTSSVIDLGQTSTFGNLDFTATAPAETTLQYQLRASASASMTGAAWLGPTGGEDYYTSSGTDINSNLDGNRYVQYKAFFTTTDQAKTATLSDLTLNYSYYPSPGTISNLVFDAAETSTWVTLSWNAANPSGSSVSYRLRTATASSALSAASWSASLTNSGSSLSSLDENRFLELELTLETTGAVTPTLNDVSLVYVQNNPPTVATPSASLANDGTGLVSVGYQLSDSEEGACTDLGSCQGVDDGAISLSLEYSTDSANWSTASAVTQTGMTVSSGTISVTSVHQTATSYTLNWEAKTDLGTSIDYQTYYLRLRADDGNAARNLTTSGEVSLTIDTASPASPTISISASPSATVEGIKRTSSTSVNLDLSATDNDNSKYMMIKINDETFADSSWESYAATKSAYSLDISSTEKTNIIYVKFKDSSGNETSPITDTVVYDVLAPSTPTNVKIADLTDLTNADYRLLISWSRIANPTGNDFRGYYLYRSTDGSDFGESYFASISARTTTYYLDQNLTKDQRYYYKVKGADQLDNVSTLSDVISAAPSIGDIDPPSLAPSTTVSITTTSTTATFTFYTTDVSYGYVDHGTNSNLTKTLGEVEAVSSQNPHSITLTNLNPGTTYSYQIRAKSVTNFEGKAKEAVLEEGQTFLTSSEATISNVQVLNLSTSSATIIWQTSELANGEVSYGTTTALGSTQAQALSDSSTNHSAFLTGLTPGVTYYYRVKSGQSFYPEANSNPASLNTTSTADTIPPEIAGEGPTTTALSTSATISWTTNKVSDSFVEYGLTTTYGTVTGKDESSLSHSVTLSGLSPSTTYHFRVKSKDSDGNTGFSTDTTFTTKEKSVFTEVTISDITLNSVILSWTTNVISSSKVKVGTKINSFDQEISEESTDKTLNHVARISNLAEGTKYYLRIDGTDGDGNAIVSDDYSLTTLSKPVINRLKIKSTEAHSVTISWETNVKSDSTISYGFSNDQLTVNKGKSDPTTSHEIKLTNLDDTTKYFFKVKSRDVSGNLAESEVSSFTTTADLLPPAISEIKSEASVIGGGESARIQIIVSWSTDEPATSMVEYDEGVGLGSNVYSFQTNEDKTLNQSHIVIVSGLKPSTSYRFRVKSTDKIGNSSNSTENTILTPPQEISILQLILKSWEETFAWTGNLHKVIPYWPF